MKYCQRLKKPRLKDVQSFDTVFNQLISVYHFTIFIGLMQLKCGYELSKACVFCYVICVISRWWLPESKYDSMGNRQHPLRITGQYNNNRAKYTSESPCSVNEHITADQQVWSYISQSAFLTEYSALKCVGKNSRNLMRNTTRSLNNYNRSAFSKTLNLYLSQWSALCRYCRCYPVSPFRGWIFWKHRPAETEHFAFFFFLQYSESHIGLKRCIQAAKSQCLPYYSMYNIKNKSIHVTFLECNSCGSHHVMKCSSKGDI